MKLKEREFQSWIIKTAERFGWRVWHCPTPMRPIGGNKFVPDPRGAGVPDLILMHPDPPRLIFAEVKGESGKLSDAQREFLKMARDVARESISAPSGSRVGQKPIGVYTWRPGVEELIEATLRGKVMVP